MAAVKSITSPMKFLIQAGLLADLGKHIKQYGDAGLIICDPFIAEKAAADSKASLAEHGVKGVFTVFGGESSDEEINRQQAEFDQAGCRFVVGIGGGKTLDTAKAVAYYKNVPVVIFPTLASTDAPCTALTVVYNADGSFNRYLFLPNNPNAVLADTKLLAAEPARFFAAGVGDGLATYFEARTCYASNGINLVLMQPSLAGLGIAKMCYETIRDYAPQAMSAVAAKAVTPALERTIEATIYMSGVGAESGGLAAAHAIHNGMTAVHDLHGAMHGEKVAPQKLDTPIQPIKVQFSYEQIYRRLQIPSRYALLLHSKPAAHRRRISNVPHPPTPLDCRLRTRRTRGTRASPSHGRQKNQPLYCRQTR
jgi:glycerol dehydrogenase